MKTKAKTNCTVLLVTGQLFHPLGDKNYLVLFRVPSKRRFGPVSFKKNLLTKIKITNCHPWPSSNRLVCCPRYDVHINEIWFFRNKFKWTRQQILSYDKLFLSWQVPLPVQKCIHPFYFHIFLIFIECT